jgi:hypothetical protein
MTTKSLKLWLFDHSGSSGLPSTLISEKPAAGNKNMPANTNNAILVIK